MVRVARIFVGDANFGPPTVKVVSPLEATDDDVVVVASLPTAADAVSPQTPQQTPVAAVPNMTDMDQTPSVETPTEVATPVDPAPVQDDTTTDNGMVAADDPSGGTNGMTDDGTTMDTGSGMDVVTDPQAGQDEQPGIVFVDDPDAGPAFDDGTTGSQNASDMGSTNAPVEEMEDI